MKTFKIGDTRTWVGHSFNFEKEYPPPIRIGDTVYDELKFWANDHEPHKYEWVEKLTENEDGSVKWVLVSLEQLPPKPAPPPKPPGFFKRLFRRNPLPKAVAHE